MFMIGKATKKKQTENTLYKMTTVGNNALICRQVYGFEQETIFSGTIEEADNFWKVTVDNR